VATPSTPTPGTIQTAPATDDAIVIRLVEPGDVDSLHRNCLSGWPLDELREEVARNVAAAVRGERYQFVAVVYDEVIGTASLVPQTHRLKRHRGEIVGVVVTPRFQRRGVARRPIAAARRRAAELGLRILMIACRGGEPANAAYTRLGFREYGRLGGGYVEPNGKVFDQVLLAMEVQPDAEEPAESAVADGSEAAPGAPAVVVSEPLPRAEEAEVVASPRERGAVRLDLLHRGRSLSHVAIDPQVVRYGAATLRVDHLGDVWTEEDCRGRGYARRLITAAVEHMRRGDGTFSLLYGIGDFYHRFGYATLGADYGVLLRNATRPPAARPDGWTARPLLEADLPAVHRLYDDATREGTMALVRAAHAPIWTTLGATARGERDDDCRVVVDADGTIGAYIWEGRGFWVVDHSRERWFPDDLTLGEVVAGSPLAADAALAACRLWAVEEARRRGKRIWAVHCGASPGSRIAAAAQYQDAATNRTSWRSAGPQVRALDTYRLLKAIEPELSRHVRTLGAGALGVRGTVRVRAETGAATIAVEPAGVDVRRAEAADQRVGEIALAQTTLIRLVLGALPLHDLLDRCEPHLDAPARACLATLFPPRQPYMYPLDHS
jgi:ribosomal protein S18 acetylase RimI-like enzyme